MKTSANAVQRCPNASIDDVLLILRLLGLQVDIEK